MTTTQFRSLPKWAQSKINVLEKELGEAQRKLHALRLASDSEVTEWRELVAGEVIEDGDRATFNMVFDPKSENLFRYTWEVGSLGAIRVGLTVAEARQEAKDEHDLAFRVFTRRPLPEHIKRVASSARRSRA